jgi:hypothetical protein
VMRAFDQVGNDDGVADALAAIGAEIGIDHDQCSLKNWWPSSKV